MPLTPKQTRFVAEYLIDLNATQAAIRAGYSAKTAGQMGDENLKKPQIQAELQKSMQERSARTEITQDRVLKELAKIGFADIRKAVKWGESMAVMNEDSGEMVIAHGLAMLSSVDIDDDTAAAISEVSESKQGLKVKFHDKRAALVDIGKHLGMFIDKAEITGKNGGPVAYASVSPQELAEAVRSVRDQF